MPQVNIQFARTLDELQPYREAWNQLTLESAQGMPVHSWAWVASYLEYCLQPGESWLCLLAFSDNRLVGVLPVIIEPHHFFKHAYPVLHAPNDFHTTSLDFLTARGWENEVALALVAALGQGMPNWFGLKLTRLPEFSPSLELAGRRLPRLHVLKEFNGWVSYLKIEGSLADYLSRIDKKNLDNLKRRKKKLGSRGLVETVVIGSQAATEQDFQNFIELEASGWKGRNGTAIKQSPQLYAFYQALTRRLAECGWLEWNFLKCGGKIIAGILAIRFNRVVFRQKIAYDEAYKEFSPGLLLGMELIEHAFQQGNTDEINHLSDVLSRYKYWQVKQRAHYNLHIFPQRLMSCLFGFVPQAAKNLLRQTPGLQQFVRNIRNKSSQDRPE